MLKPLDINQTTFDALNNAATVVYEAVYEAAYEAVSDAVSEVDASHFHELSQNSINLKWRLHYSLKIKTVKVKCPVLDFLIIILENHFFSDIIQFHHARMFGYFTQYYNYHYYSNCNYYVNSQIIQAIIITFQWRS